MKTATNADGINGINQADLDGFDYEPVLAIGINYPFCFGISLVS